MKKVIALLVLLFSISCGKQKRAIEIAGSDTMLELVQALAEEFANETNIRINVSGGGSGTGIARLINNAVDIADASRKIKESEKKLAEKNRGKIYEVKVAIDAIAIVVNPGNSVKNLSVNQLAAIYKGEITNWKEVGGPNLPISLYGRQNNSGTYLFFREHVLKNQDYSPNMMGMNGNAQIVEAVKNDKGGIGYVGLGYVKEAKDQIKIVSINNIEPTDKKAVLNGKYLLERFLFQYVSENTLKKKEVKEFYRFLFSRKAQKIVKKVGFYPLGEEKAKELNKEVYRLIK